MCLSHGGNECTLANVNRSHLPGCMQGGARCHHMTKLTPKYSQLQYRIVFELAYRTSVTSPLSTANPMANWASVQALSFYCFSHEDLSLSNKEKKTKTNKKTKNKIK